jgi:hypothetical protein
MVVVLAGLRTCEDFFIQFEYVGMADFDEAQMVGCIGHCFGLIRL